MLFDTYLHSSWFPSIYFLLVLTFLFPLFILITYQLVKIILREITLYFLYKRRETNYTFNQLVTVLKMLVDKSLWFESIKLLEVNQSIPMKSMHQYFNFIGFIYYCMRQYDLAQLYYLKAINLKKNYVIALQNLAKVYDKQKKYMLAMLTYKSILLYDKKNTIANQYLQSKRIQ